MCFGIRISSPLHLATQITPIHNIDCTKNAKNACGDMILGMIFHECGMLFHKCVIFFHEYGMHYTSTSKVCHFHWTLTLKNQKCFGNLKQPSAWNCGIFAAQASCQMKRPQNSDSITHVKRQNSTFRTETRRKSLKYLFLETPCMYVVHIVWSGFTI